MYGGIKECKALFRWARFGAILVDYFAIRGTTSVLQVSKGRAVEEEEENKMSTKLEKKSTYFGDSSYSSSTSPPRH